MKSKQPAAWKNSGQLRPVSPDSVVDDVVFPKPGSGAPLTARSLHEPVTTLVGRRNAAPISEDGVAVSSAESSESGLDLRKNKMPKKSGRSLSARGNSSIEKNGIGNPPGLPLLSMNGAVDGSGLATEPFEKVLRRVLREELNGIFNDLGFNNETQGASEGHFTVGEETVDKDGAEATDGIDNTCSRKFEICDRVQVRDNMSDDWCRGTVRSVFPLLVEVNGDAPRVWAYVERPARRFGSLEELSKTVHSSPWLMSTTAAHIWEEEGDWFRRHLYWRCMRLAHWKEELWKLEEPERQGLLARIVRSQIFELSCALIILLNSVYMFFALNYQMRHVGDEPPQLMKVAELLFVLAYAIELISKVTVHRGYFYIGDNAAWNTFDTFLVVISVEGFISQQIGVGEQRQVAFLRVLRILKMAKFLRVLRLMSFLSELRLLMNSLLGSLVSLGWSVVAMALIFYIFGLIFVSGTVMYFIDHGNDVDELLEGKLRDAFGSIQDAIITLLCASTGGQDWLEFYQILIPTGNGWIFIGFVLFSHIALMNILTGLFVEKAMKLAEPDREAVFMQKRKAEVLQMKEITQLCDAMDTDHDGVISHTEFQRQMSHPGSKLRTYLGTLGLTRDAELFYHMVQASRVEDGNEEGIEVHSFVQSCMKLKGTATSLDMQGLAMQMKRMQKQLKTLIVDQTSRGKSQVEPRRSSVTPRRSSV